MSLFPALNTAVSGLDVFQQDINVVGNNIANVNTIGYKTGRVDAEDTFSAMLGAGSAAQAGTGVAATAIQSNFGNGTIANTGVSTDLAISGNGFFSVKNSTDGSQFYTRAGDFHLDQAGYLVNPDGLRVQGFSDAALSSQGDIKIDATGAPSTAAAGATLASFSIDNTGKISVTLIDGTTFTRGQILLSSCPDPNALSQQGDNLYSKTDAAGTFTTAAPLTSGLGKISSSSLEMSNVDLSSEMANLIAAQRGFEANAKIVTTSDEILQDLVNLKR